jgi:predicted nucleotidyltransferase
MKLSLKEYMQDRGIVFAFGRMNPITSGHEELVKGLAKAAKKYKADAVLYLSPSHDPQKNPLKFLDKVKFAKAAFPQVRVSDNPMVKNPYQAILDAIDDGYKRIYMAAGEDRISSFETMIRRILKDFPDVEIKVIDTGDRTPGISGTAMRNLVKAGDLNTFTTKLPKMLQPMARQVFDKVKKGLRA